MMDDAASLNIDYLYEIPPAFLIQRDVANINLVTPLQLAAQLEVRQP